MAADEVDDLHTLVRRLLPRWEIVAEGIEMFRPNRFAVVRYRYRGTKIPTPWAAETDRTPPQRREHMESQMR